MLIVISALIAGALMLVSIVDGEGFRRYWRLKSEMDALEARIASLKTQNASLSREVEALRDDPVALERAAREELGYISPGEVVLNLE
jgi:cell division protein FtsB